MFFFVFRFRVKIMDPPGTALKGMSQTCLSQWYRMYASMIPTVYPIVASFGRETARVSDSDKGLRGKTIAPALSEMHIRKPDRRDSRPTRTIFAGESAHRTVKRLLERQSR